MNLSNKNLMILLPVFLVTLIMVTGVNRWATEELKEYTTQTTTDQPAAQERRTVSLHHLPHGKPVVIDPNNDPLAPRKPEPVKRTFGRRQDGGAQTIHEMPTGETILAQ